MSDRGENIVFYDGDCGFCNRTVQFVLKNDASKSIKFAPLQSSFTKDLFLKNNFPAPDLSTFYFLKEGRLYEKSTAALKLASFFRYPQKLAVIFWVIPRFIRDGLYDSIAKRRQRLMKGFCVLPDENDKERFLS